MNPEVRILETGQLETPAGQIQHLFVAGRDLFMRRSERFRCLASEHPLGDYLAFLGVLAGAQQEALDQLATLHLPDSRDQQHGRPLLEARSWPRNPVWQEGLSIILEKIDKTDLPPAARMTVNELLQANASSLEEMAENILAGNLAGISPQKLPFVAAALQVYWVHMATTLGEGAFGSLEQGGLCPVCGSYPSAGIVKQSGAGQGLRYLCCSLCASQWHMVRIKCSNCASTQGINHYALEGSDGAVKTESCDECGTYLKLFYLGKDPRMEAMADDLATLALDMLMDAGGKVRGGPNLFFHPGRD